MNYEEMSAFELLFESVKEASYEERFDALVKKDKTGWSIADAGWLWKEFDYEKGLDALIRIDKTGEHIYHAAWLWKKLNYKKARAHLKKISPDYYYKQALEEWPMSAEDALEKVGNELSGKKRIRDRKFKL